MPIKDRPGFTIRCLYYLSKINFAYKIIIADGSLNEDTLLALEENTFDNLDYEYIRFPPDHTYYDFIFKMNGALDLIDSDYIYWLCDDDFINTDCIEDGIEFLEKNIDYSMYTGQVVNFELPWANPARPHMGKPLVGNNCYSMTESVVKKQVIKRLSLINNVKPFEAVHRTFIFKEFFRKALQFNVVHHYEFSMLFNCTVLLEGNAHVAGKLIVLRQHDTPHSAGSLIFTENTPFGFFVHNNYPDFIYDKIIPYVEEKIISNNEGIMCKDVHLASMEIMRQTIQFYDRLIKKKHLSVNPAYAFIRLLLPDLVVKVIRHFKVTPHFKRFACLKGANNLHSISGLKYVSSDFYDIVHSVCSTKQKNL